MSDNEDSDAPVDNKPSPKPVLENKWAGWCGLYDYYDFPTRGCNDDD